MSKRFLSRSLFRPASGIDQSTLVENKPLIQSLERRLFLRQGLSLGALTLLTGCDISNKESVQGVLKAFSQWNDRVQAWLFDPTKLAPTFSEA
ncbi:MAG: molybdopterin-binding protein, partial [Hyphomicrobiales bacterium]|nr:molybdopterin-binding protein [Hyphomicrobiales bacterium]